MIPLPALSTVMPDGTTNPCGGCDACCVALRIEWLDKDKGVRCEHLTAGGCGVHDAGRGAECTDFRCLWLSGVTGGGLDTADERKLLSLRPDNLGVLLTGVAEIFEVTEARDGTRLPAAESLRVLVAVELRPGAFETPLASWFCCSLAGAAGVPIMLREHGDGRRIVIPECPRAAEIKARVDRHLRLKFPPAAYTYREDPRG